MNKWIEEFAGFASRNRRRTAAEGKLIGGCCANAVESPTGGAKEKTIRFGWSFLCFSYRCARKSLPVSHRAAGAILHRVRQHTVSHAAAPHISLFPADFPADLTKTFLKYIFVLQAAKNPICFFFRSLYFSPQIRYTDIGK